MNSQFFNYIFDIKDIGLNIVKYLSFKDCIKSFNFYYRFEAPVPVHYFLPQILSG